jgi:copper chaperone CopZ
MKNIKSILAAIAIFAAFQVNAQTETKRIDSLQFEVKGVCLMCKERIEKSALVKGVKLAEWDKATHQITVIYKPAKITKEEIHKAIAESGHSTSLLKTSLDNYEKLPACCAYKEVHDH